MSVNMVIDAKATRGVPLVPGEIPSHKYRQAYGVITTAAGLAPERGFGVRRPVPRPAMGQGSGRTADPAPGPP
jgi:hypothetical protein